MSHTQKDTTRQSNTVSKTSFLDAQAKQGRERKQQIYRLMDVQSGQRVLDVGSGPGTDTLPLGQLVGPTGQVVGVDRDDPMIAEANHRASEAGVGAWVEHRLADASSLPFVNDTFDVCHAERLFMHLPNPEDVFAEMVRVTKPGGWLAVIDADWASGSMDTAEIDVERRLSRFVAEVHTNPYGGRRLYRFFKQHNMTDISIDVEAEVVTNLAAVRYIAVLDEREEMAVRAGVITRDELERFRADLEETDKIGAFYASLNRVTIVARKPH